MGEEEAAGQAGDPYDCIVVGAGPGGLQAAIYLARYNRRVLVIDRGAGRTTYARHIENFLGQQSISGRELIAAGKRQAESFGAQLRKGTVTRIEKPGPGPFKVQVGEELFRATFVVVSTGGTENLPEIENIHAHFGTSVFTCIDCDGYRTTGRKLVVVGDSPGSVNLALALHGLFTPDVTLVLLHDHAPPAARELLAEAGIGLVVGTPRRFVGAPALAGLEMADGRLIPCEVAYSNFGFTAADACVAGLGLARAPSGKYQVDRHFQTSFDGLYMVGSLVGSDQVAVAVGEGALAALDLKKRLIELLG